MFLLYLRILKNFLDTQEMSGSDELTKLFVCRYWFYIRKNRSSSKNIRNFVPLKQTSLSHLYSIHVECYVWTLKYKTAKKTVPIKWLRCRWHCQWLSNFIMSNCQPKRKKNIKKRRDNLIWSFKCFSVLI